MKGCPPSQDAFVIFMKVYGFSIKKWFMVLGGDWHAGCGDALEADGIPIYWKIALVKNPASQDAIVTFMKIFRLLPAKTGWVRCISYWNSLLFRWHVGFPGSNFAEFLGLSPSHPRDAIRHFVWRFIVDSPGGPNVTWWLPEFGHIPGPVNQRKYPRVMKSSPAVWIEDSEMPKKPRVCSL